MVNKTQRAIIHAVNNGYVVDDNGLLFRNGKLLKQKKHGGQKRPNYYAFSIVLDGGSFPLRTHRLVAYQKYGDAIFNDGIMVRHLNGNRFDNSVGNIAIGTASDNMMDRPKSDRVDHATLASSFNKRDDWEAIKEDRRRGFSYNKLSDKYGVGKGALSYHFNTRRRG